MARRLRSAVLCALLFCGALPWRSEAADPLAMLLIGIARDMLLSHILREARREPAPPAPPPRVYPGTTVEPAQLRRLIDESFGYLSEAQREEVFDALQSAILDPRHAAIRASLLEYFAHRALAVRAMRERLARLSVEEKVRVAEEFRAALAALPPDERGELGEALRRGLLPVPEDLGQMMLAALSR
jgi:DNA-directed RNA polymerase specialized sigma24 family protein